MEKINVEIVDPHQEYFKFNKAYCEHNVMKTQSLVNILGYVNDLQDDILVACNFNFEPGRGIYEVNGLASSKPYNKAFRGIIQVRKCQICIYLEINKIKVNVPVTELVIIKPKEDKIVCETTYEMGDTSIYKKENIKYDNFINDCYVLRRRKFN